MTEMDFMVMTAGILKECLEDVPDEYSIRFEYTGMSYPIMDYEVQDEFKEFTLKYFEVKETPIEENNQTYKEFVETTLKTAIENERTELGQSVLKQLKEQLR